MDNNQYTSGSPLVNDHDYYLIQTEFNNAMCGFSIQKARLMTYQQIYEMMSTSLTEWPAVIIAKLNVGEYTNSFQMYVWGDEFGYPSDSLQHAMRLIGYDFDLNEVPKATSNYDIRIAYTYVSGSYPLMLLSDFHHYTNRRNSIHFKKWYEPLYCNLVSKLNEHYDELPNHIQYFVDEWNKYRSS